MLTIRHIEEHHINEQIRNELKNKYEKVYDLVNEFGKDVMVSIFACIVNLIPMILGGVAK